MPAVITPPRSKAWLRLSDASKIVMRTYSLDKTPEKAIALCRIIEGCLLLDRSLVEAFASYHEAAARLLRAQGGPVAAVNAARSEFEAAALAVAHLVLLRFEGDRGREYQHSSRSQWQAAAATLTGAGLVKAIGDAAKPLNVKRSHVELRDDFMGALNRLTDEDLAMYVLGKGPMRRRPPLPGMQQDVARQVVQSRLRTSPTFRATLDRVRGET